MTRAREERLFQRALVDIDAVYQDTKLTNAEKHDLFVRLGSRCVENQELVRPTFARAVKNLLANE